MSSIVAANTQPEFTGLAPDTFVLPLRVLGKCQQGYASDVTDAIVWAAGGEILGLHINPTPAHTIMMAFAGSGPCPTFLQSAVNIARNQGNPLHPCIPCIH
jgi:serine protease